MALSLGPVKPWVRSAAEEVQRRFSPSSIGGWRAHGSVPNSGHPKGLATDFMIRDNAHGQEIADYLQANAKRLGIDYLIWDRQIWHPGGPWKSYSGPSPHTDHVHASFIDRAPAGGSVADSLPLGGGVTGGITGVARGVSDVATSTARIADMVTRFALPTMQVRIWSGVLGAVLLVIGVVIIGREALR